MKRLFAVSLLFLLPLFILAQVNTSKEEAMKTHVALDYSVPDFDTRRIDGKVIGTRLAKILHFMNEHINDHTIRSLLISILCEQDSRLQYAIIKNVKILNIRKSGSEINVIIKLRIGQNPFGIKKSEIVLRFIDGVSESIPTNDLFIHICNYIR